MKDATDSIGSVATSTSSRSWLKIWAKWTVWLAIVYAFFYGAAMVGQYDWEWGWLEIGIPIGLIAGPFYAAVVTTPVMLYCRIRFHLSEPGRILGERIAWYWGLPVGALLGIALGVLFTIFFNPPPHYNGGNWL